MPFTIAHAAAIYPFRKLKIPLSVTAFVVGAMVPDLEGFLYLRTVNCLGHTPAGILLFDVPAGLLFCYVFHCFLKTPLLHNLPVSYSKRLAAYLFFDWKKFVLNNKVKVLVSLLTGILTHLLWDGFTHANGLFVKALPFLSENITFLQWKIPYYFILQLFSSAVGIVFVFRWINKKPVQYQSVHFSNRGRYYWLMLITVAVLIFSVRFLLGEGHNTVLSLTKACIGAILYAGFFASLAGWSKRQLYMQWVCGASNRFNT
jgi:Domain of unknown function (DUF4184)